MVRGHAIGPPRIYNTLLPANSDDSVHTEMYETQSRFGEGQVLAICGVPVTRFVYSTLQVTLILTLAWTVHPDRSKTVPIDVPRTMSSEGSN